jgi:predicted dehydrogenase
MTVGVVGCGAWGSLILRDLKALGCSVPVVARSPASVERAQSGGASLVVPDSDALPPCEGFIVATTATTHASVIEQLLDRNVPVFVEKPLCGRVDEALDFQRRAGDRLFVMDKWRYHNGIRLIAAMIRNGDVGEVTAITTRRVGWGNHHPDVDILSTYLPHDLAITLELIGSIPPLAGASFESIDGHITGASIRLGSEPTVTMEFSAVAAATHRELRVIGTTGCLVMGGGYAEEVLWSRGRPTSAPERVPFEANMPLFDELRAFVEHLAGGPPPLSNLDDAIAQMKTIEAVHTQASRQVTDVRFSGW